MEKNQPAIENPCSPAPDLPPEMMEEILQYLPLNDILSCRLVWKDHDAIMKDFIGKKMKPLRFNLKTEGLRDHLKNYPNSPVPDELHLKLTFEEDHETIKEICENLKGRIKHLKVDMERNYRDSEAEEIIADTSRNNRHTLTVSNARLLIHVMDILGESLETVEFGLLKQGFLQTANGKAKKSSVAGNFNFPSLQKITMIGEIPEGKLGSEVLSRWNQLLFKNSGKLKSLQLQRSRYIHDPNRRRLPIKEGADVLNDLHEVGRLGQITSLRLLLLSNYSRTRDERESNLDTLLKYEADGGLQIEELLIKNKSYWGNEDAEKLDRILKMQSKKLKILSLNGSGLKELKMPVMEQLTSLKLPAEDCLVEKICFSKITPKLKSLEVEIKGSDEELKKLFDKPNLCKTLETLKISKYWSRQDPLNAWVCEIFANKFPSITSLTLGNPSEDFLQKLGTVWTNLLMLDLTLCKEFKDLDRSLFGITPEWKKSVSKKVDQWWTLNQPPSDSQLLSICNLEKLQTLRIRRGLTPEYGSRLRRIQGRAERRQIESNFSEFSYFYGLKNMKHLKVFTMNQGSTVPYEEEISVQAREFIRKELPSLRIH